TTNPESARAMWSFGASDGTHHHRISWGADDAVTTSNTAEGNATTEALSIFTANTTPTVGTGGTITGVAFNSNNFVVTFNTTPASAWLIDYILIGGSDVTNAFVGSTAQRTSTGTQNYTGVGFKGDFLLLFMTNQTAAGNTNAATGTIGCAVSSSKRWAYGMAAADAAGTAGAINAMTILRNDAVVVTQNTSNSVTTVADFVQFTTDGFDLNYTTNPGSAFLTHYLVIKGGTWDCGTSAKPTTATTQSVTSQSVTPKLLGLLCSSPTANNTNTSNAITTFGATDGTNQCYACSIANDVRATVAKSMGSATACSHERDGANNPDATFTSFNSNGWTITWGATGSARLVGWFTGANTQVAGLDDDSWQVNSQSQPDPNIAACQATFMQSTNDDLAPLAAADILGANTYPQPARQFTLRTGTQSVRYLWTGDDLAATVSPTGTAATNQAAQSLAASGKEIFTGTETSDQAGQAVSISAKEVFSATETSEQNAQSLAAAGKEVFAGSETSSQSAQSLAASGSESFAAAETSAQAAQALSASGSEIITGSLASDQAQQSLSANDHRTYTGMIANDQPAQSLAASGKEIISGAATSAQAGQTDTQSGKEQFLGTANYGQAAQSELAAGTEIISGTCTTSQAKQALIATDIGGFAGTCTTEQAAQGAAALGITSSGGVVGYVSGRVSNRVAPLVGQVELKSPARKTTKAEPQIEPLPVRLRILSSASTAQLANFGMGFGRESLTGTHQNLQGPPSVYARGEHIDTELEIIQAILSIA